MTYTTYTRGRRPGRQMKKSKYEPLNWAFVALSVGVLLLMRNFDLLDERTSRMIFSWPMLLVAMGILNLKRSSFGFGFLLILVGLFLVFSREYDLHFGFWDVFWPTLLLLAGMGLLTASVAIFRKRNIDISKNLENSLDEVSVFGGNSRSFRFTSFMGGSIVAVMGGSKIDLTGSRLADGINQLSIVAVFGGCELIVPEEWDIKAEVFSLPGNFIDNRHKVQPETGKKLIIRGIAIFGGGKIKSSYYKN